MGRTPRTRARIQEYYRLKRLRAQTTGKEREEISKKIKAVGSGDIKRIKEVYPDFGYQLERKSTTIRPTTEKQQKRDTFAIKKYVKGELSEKQLSQRFGDSTAEKVRGYIEQARARGEELKEAQIKRAEAVVSQAEAQGRPLTESEVKTIYGSTAQYLKMGGEQAFLDYKRSLDIKQAPDWVIAEAQARFNESPNVQKVTIQGDVGTYSFVRGKAIKQYGGVISQAQPFEGQQIVESDFKMSPIKEKIRYAYSVFEPASEKIRLPVPKKEKWEARAKKQYEKDIAKYEQLGTFTPNKYFNVPKSEKWREKAIKGGLSFEEYREGSRYYGMSVDTLSDIAEKPVKYGLITLGSAYIYPQAMAGLSGAGMKGLAYAGRYIPMTATRIIGTVGGMLGKGAGALAFGVYAGTKYKKYTEAKTEREKGFIIGQTGAELSAISLGAIGSRYVPPQYRGGERYLELAKPQYEVATGVATYPKKVEFLGLKLKTEGIAKIPATEKAYKVAGLVTKGIKEGYEINLPFKRQYDFTLGGKISPAKAYQLRLQLAQQGAIYQGSGVQRMTDPNIRLWKELGSSTTPRIQKDIDVFTARPQDFAKNPYVDPHDKFMRLEFPFAKTPVKQKFGQYTEQYITSGEQLARKGIGMYGIRTDMTTGKGIQYRFGKDFNDFVNQLRAQGQTEIFTELRTIATEPQTPVTSNNQYLGGGTWDKITIKPTGTYYSRPTQKLADLGLVRPATEIDFTEIAPSLSSPSYVSTSFTRVTPFTALLGASQVTPPPPREASILPYKVSASPSLSASVSPTSSFSYSYSKYPSSLIKSLSASPSRSYSPSSKSFRSPSFRSPSPSPSISPSISPSPSLSPSPSISPSISPSPSLSPSPSISYSSLIPKPTSPPPTFFDPYLPKKTKGVAGFTGFKITRQPKAFTPTGRAIVFGLKGKTPKASTTTGLGTRFITQRFNLPNLKVGG